MIRWRFRVHLLLTAALCSSGAACGAGGAEDDADLASLLRLDSLGVRGDDGSAMLIGAGDIARCRSSGDEATARLLDSIPGLVFTVGDNAYGNREGAELEDCFTPSWGRHRARIRPTPGNHEYRHRGAGPYFRYFGDAAGPPGRGYYAYEYGGWLILALNSVIDGRSRSAELRWLARVLDANSTRCTLAYWHNPRFSSGYHGDDRSIRRFWDILYEAGVDVVVNGHDHNYERFAPQSPAGVADEARGIRQFIVGTGGADLRPLPETQPRATSEVRIGGTYGVLRLVLRDDGYAWAFITAPAGTIADSGTGSCH